MSNRLDFPSLSKSALVGPVLLSTVPAGERVWQILAVRCTPADTHVLAQEGVEPGSRVQVIHHEGQGLIALRVRCRVLVLGRRYPAHIEVAPLPDTTARQGRLIPFHSGNP